MSIYIKAEPLNMEIAKMWEALVQKTKHDESIEGLAVTRACMSTLKCVKRIIEEIENDPETVYNDDPKEKKKRYDQEVERINKMFQVSIMKQDCSAQPEEGYKKNPLYVEKKSKRVQLVLQQGLYARVKEKADKVGLSFNEYCCQLLADETDYQKNMMFGINPCMTKDTKG